MPKERAARQITKAVVDNLRPGQIAWDRDMKGFGIRCQRRYKIFVLKYRIGGRQRWYSIGKHGSPWTADKARKEAARLLGHIAAGHDPANARDEAKHDLTMSELCDLYVTEGCTIKKTSTLATDRGRIERHIKPLLGRRRVGDVRRADVERLLRDVAVGKTALDEKTGFRGRSIVKGGKGVASKTVALLGAIFTFAVERGLRPDNPARGVKKYKDRQFERFLSSAELSRLGEALAGAEQEGANPFAIAAIRLLALSGCRKSEVLTLRWEPDPAGAGYVDFERGCLHLMESKSGSKRVLLGAPALEILAKLPRIEGSPYVFPGNSGGHFVGLQRIWNQIRRRAGISDVRLHDLRHSYASVGVAGGDSLYLVGKILGHRQASTSQRYAHLSDDPLRAVADRTARQIASAMSPQGGGEVVPLPTRKA